MGIWRNPQGTARTQTHPFNKDTPDSWVQNQLVFTERPPRQPWVLQLCRRFAGRGPGSGLAV